MSKEISCGDVVKGCQWTAAAANEEELLKKVIAHAEEAHGVHEVTPELAAQVMAVAFGFLFALYPAAKASRQSPMEALRYE